MRHIGEVLDDIGHVRPADDDAFGQALDRLGDKIALALIVGAHRDEKDTTIGAAVGADIKWCIEAYDGGTPIPTDDGERTKA